MDGAERDRAIERIRLLSVLGMDLVSFWRECTPILERTVPHYLSPCWFTCDPATLLVTSHFQDGMLEIPGEWLAQEYYEDDFNKVVDVARSPQGVATLHDATGGRPERSSRYVEHMVPYGAYQESLTALRTRSGETWGVLGLYRGKDAHLFDDSEKRFLAAAAPHLADGALRALLAAQAREPDLDNPPAMVVLSRSWEMVSATPNATAWLAELPEPLDGRDLPPVVYAVAGEALATAANERSESGPSARLRGRSGQWLAVHGSMLSSVGGETAVAIIIERADSSRIAPLLMSAYGLTEREREVATLVLGGCSTAEIATALTVTTNTVQQHLKGIFEKTGVNSRRDLAGKVFFSHYEPRVRDNERRVEAARHVRGGPHPLAPTPAGSGPEGRRLRP